MRIVPFCVFGAGGVGSALIEAVIGARTLHESRYGVRLAAVALADSSGVVRAPKGGEISDSSLVELVRHKKGGGKLLEASTAGIEAVAQPSDQSTSDFLKSIVGECGTRAPGCIVVDLTASDATVPALLLAGAGDSGLKVVSANKKPFASSLATFEQLVLAPGGSARVRYESTVGAGLPVIAALQRVVGAHDGVSLISGSFSGTLGYVMSGLQEGKPFSEVVGKAKELGYTEPDPRDDLGGVDVARKALILARTLGMKLEMDDVKVEPLYPPELASLSVNEFMAALPTLDADFAARVAAAAAEGKVLRYAASVQPANDGTGGGSLTVGLLPVGASTPLGTLSGRCEALGLG